MRSWPLNSSTGGGGVETVPEGETRSDMAVRPGLGEDVDAVVARSDLATSSLSSGIGEASGVSTSATGVNNPDGTETAGAAVEPFSISVRGCRAPPNLNVFNRSLCAFSSLDCPVFVFPGPCLDSHSLLMRSAAEGSLTAAVDGVAVRVTMGIFWSCSNSCRLWSLLSLRGGRSPRARNAASRASFAVAETVGSGTRVLLSGDGDGERVRNLVASIRIIVRDLDCGCWSGLLAL